MKETTKINRYVLKNEPGKYVQLTSEIMAAIYDILETLGVKMEKSKPLDEKKTLREKAYTIANKLRSNEKIKGEEPVNPIEDNFDYKRYKG